MSRIGGVQLKKVGGVRVRWKHVQREARREGAPTFFYRVQLRGMCVCA